MDGTTTGQNATKGAGPVRVIHAALFRSATKSLAEAYKILGYRTHHALDGMTGPDWVLVEQAADATWPWLPDATARPPYTRKDWDALWGGFDVLTDLAAVPWTLQLIEAYPDAKVVIVERDVDKWWPSFKEACLDTLYGFWPQLGLAVAEQVLGLRAGQAMRKVWKGMMGVKTDEEVRDENNAREMHRLYYRLVREMVPPERKLEYKIGDGWEPLCRFLGDEVPDVPFPWVNDRAEHHAAMSKGRAKVWRGLGMVLLTAIAVAAISVGIYTYS
jgi:hypothetical protein